MSGDLEDPGKGLPRGTFAAVGLSIIVYFISSVLFAAALPRDALIGDYGAMLAVDLTAGIVAVAVLFAIFQYLKRTAGPARWADSRRSYHLQIIREHLLAAAAEPMHPRNWRPQILAFSDDSDRRAQVLRFASWIEGQSGLTNANLKIWQDGLRFSCGRWRSF